MFEIDPLIRNGKQLIALKFYKIEKTNFSKFCRALLLLTWTSSKILIKSPCSFIMINMTLDLIENE